jgi:hypothetical protein
MLEDALLGNTTGWKRRSACEDSHLPLGDAIHNLWALCKQVQASKLHVRDNEQTHTMISELDSEDFKRARMLMARCCPDT